MKRSAQYCLLVGSVLFCTLVFALELGLKNTPSETLDSLGRPMRFNDPFSAEHYWIMAGNIRVEGFLEGDFLFARFLIAAHLLGFVAVFLSRWKRWFWTRWYFAIQGIIFPMGWIGLFFLPFNVSAIVSSSLDREGVTDFPFTMMITHPVWFAAASFVFFLNRSALLEIGRDVRGCV